MRPLLLLIGVIAAGVAFGADGGQARAAASRTWPPFVLVAGLLLIGLVAFEDGAFDRAAALTGRVKGSGRSLFAVLLALVALVTAVLNLDTAVVFLTPVLVLAARRRGLAEEPFLYGSLFMANSASLLLPGSNLTNLLVLARDHVSGAVFAVRMFPAWVAATLVTFVVLATGFRRVLARRGEPDRQPADRPGGRVGVGVTLVAAGLVLALPSPALPVFAFAAVVAIVSVSRTGMHVADLVDTLDLPVLVALFGLAVALGTLAGAWSGPARLLQSASAWETAAIGAGAAMVVNNLPAAVMLSARPPAHPRALLIGLDLGPNLAVTGSLSALLWYRAATTVGSRPSLLRVSRIGVVLVPCSAAAALVALRLFAP